MAASLIRGRWLAIVIVFGMCLPVVGEDSTAVPENHPLTSAMEFASAQIHSIQFNIRDYSGRLIKRERIDGQLQSYQFINVKMRCEQERDGERVPMAVFMHYLAPQSLRDRRVLYIEGQYNGRMLVRKGGTSLEHVKLRIAPDSASARRESNYPITDIGFDKMVERLRQRMIEDMRNDPLGDNTIVNHFTDAQVGDRVCTRIQVLHPQQSDKVDFHEANLFVDDELQLPIRLTVHSWPEKPSDDPLLMEEYTYVNLRVNVGLTDADFNESQLESRSEAANMAAAK